MAKDYYNYNIDILQFKRLSELNEKTISICTYVDVRGEKHQYRLIILEQRHGLMQGL